MTTTFPSLQAAGKTVPTAPTPAWFQTSAASLEKDLVTRFGEPQRERIQRGLRQTAAFWQEGDGNAAAYEKFVRDNFAGDTATLDGLFNRFERILEKMDGQMNEMRYELRLQLELDLGPLLPSDELFAGHEPAAHLVDDFFRNKLAFVVLLNFPLTTLDERLKNGDKWTRRQWAEVRLAQRFSKRIPAAVNQEIAEAATAADTYVWQYYICLHHLIDAQGGRLFPPGLRLISHWGLRDEIKAQYLEGANGLARQRMIQKVMERIIDQSIPAVVIDNPRVDWAPFANTVTASTVTDLTATAVSPLPIAGTPEPDTRYAMLLRVFHACRKADPYSPAASTLIARRFEDDRQMSETRVREMLEQVLTSPEFASVGKLVSQRLGRPLEPFDIWYRGFRPRGPLTTAQLDEKVRALYPDGSSYRNDMTNLLVRLDFKPDRAAFLQSLIDVEPARGSGHAMGGLMRGEKARLRTRIESGGMTYKGFNIALHELGHNIEQTFSMNCVDHTLLQGVPNNSFTEGFAMFLQTRDLPLLGVAQSSPADRAGEVLDEFWATAEICGVGLVDAAAWHWLYEHPDATPAQLKTAVTRIACDIWNRFYAPVFGRRDTPILAIYSHMLNNILYLPDYPVGHMIAFQVEEQVRKNGHLGDEFERMASYGNVTPDLWMNHATGEPVGPQAMLRAAKAALADMPKP